MNLNQKKTHQIKQFGSNNKSTNINKTSITTTYASGNTGDGMGQCTSGDVNPVIVIRHPQ